MFRLFSVLMLLFALLFLVGIVAADSPDPLVGLVVAQEDSPPVLDTGQPPDVVYVQQPENDVITLVLGFVAGIAVIAAATLPVGVVTFLRGVRDSPKATDPLERLLLIMVAAPLLKQVNKVAEAVEAGAGIVDNLTDGQLGSPTNK